MKNTTDNTVTKWTDVRHIFEKKNDNNYVVWQLIPFSHLLVVNQYSNQLSYYGRDQTLLLPELYFLNYLIKMQEIWTTFRGVLHAWLALVESNAK